MAQRPDKKKGLVSSGKKKSASVKKASVKKENESIKKLPTSPPEIRMNIRCRYCFFVDGYTSDEKVCHNCGREIYEVDKI